MLSGLAFIVLAALNRSGRVNDLDREVFLRMREIRGPWLDVLGGLDDVLFRVIPTFALAFAIAAALAWSGPRWAWSAPLFIAGTAIIEFAFKRSWRVPLHPGELIAAAQELLGARALALASFPSGHVARATFLAVIAWSFVPRPLAVPIVAAAATTYFARIYTEAHRLSDVLGGIALGLFVGGGATWWVATRLRNTGG